MLARRMFASLFVLAALSAFGGSPQRAAMAGGQGQPTDWQRFYYYPYVYYPQNFQRPRSFNHMYYRYPQERRIPVYNKGWYNYYTQPRPYHSGHHFILDVF